MQLSSKSQSSWKHRLPVQWLWWQALHSPSDWTSTWMSGLAPHRLSVQWLRWPARHPTVCLCSNLDDRPCTTQSACAVTWMTVPLCSVSEDQAVISQYTCICAAIWMTGQLELLSKSQSKSHDDTLSSTSTEGEIKPLSKFEKQFA